jgi:Aspartyl protease
MRKINLFLIGFYALVINPGCTCAQSTGNFVPVKAFKTVLPVTYRSGANPVIMVKINGKGPYRFMFDTGSPDLIKLDEAVFNELQLPVTDSVRAGDGSGINVKTFPVTTVSVLELGDYKVENINAMVRNYNQNPGVDKIDGVVGLSIFKNVSVELNFEKNQFIIGTEKPVKGANTIAYTLQNGVPKVRFLLGSREIEALFDTGNMGGFTLHSADVSEDRMMGKPLVTGTARTVNNTFEIKQVQVKDDLKIGTIVFFKPTISMNDLLPHANAGILLLKQMNITFYPGNNLVRLVKYEPEKMEAAANSIVNEYAGKYGDRTITANEKGELFIQRSGPSGGPAGMILKMIAKNKDEFGLEIVPGAVLKFERDASGKITAIHVTRGDGNWERAAKDD